MFYAWDYTDNETVLVQCSHRSYDPSEARWLNRDPIGYDGGIDLYAYVDNGPLAGVDPSGWGEIPKGPPVSYQPGEENGQPGVWKTYRNGARVFEPDAPPPQKLPGHGTGGRNQGVKAPGQGEHNRVPKGNRTPPSTGGGRPFRFCPIRPIPEPGMGPADPNPSPSPIVNDPDPIPIDDGGAPIFEGGIPVFDFP